MEPATYLTRISILIFGEFIFQFFILSTLKSKLVFGKGIDSKCD